MRVVVIGAGPAGVMAALRAAELGAATTLVTREHFGGMAATDGPVPVRTLAYAARTRLLAQHLERYGFSGIAPRLDLLRLLARAREVAREVAGRSTLRRRVEEAGIRLVEHAGTVRLVGAHAARAANGDVLQADRFVVCTGGVPRALPAPGAELAVSHSAAWTLTALPATLLVIGGGMTGLQVAFIFAALGSDVQLFQRGERLLPDEDDDISAEVTAALRAAGIRVHEGFGEVTRFEPAPAGVRMHYERDGRAHAAEAALAVSAVGWTADTSALGLEAAGVQVDRRGFIAVDEHLATSQPHIFAAGDVTGRSVLVPPAVLDGHVAGTNAVLGPSLVSEHGPVPRGGFTHPEYASIGPTERAARRTYDVAVGLVRFDESTRHIIDGRTDGFCKLVADRATRRILACHAVGERSADLVQAVAIAMAGGLTVDRLARTPLAFPTYPGVLSRAAFRAARACEPSFTVPGAGAEI